jgi:hypothetical protein
VRRDVVPSQFVPVSFKVASEPRFGLVVNETITLLVGQGRGDEAHAVPRNFFQRSSSEWQN